MVLTRRKAGVAGHRYGSVPAVVPIGAAADHLQIQMWRKLLYSGFQMCFAPSTQGAGIRYQNTSQIQILLASHFYGTI